MGGTLVLQMRHQFCERHEMLAERGIMHMHRKWKGGGAGTGAIPSDLSPWHTDDETYVKVKSRWAYLYRTVVSQFPISIAHHKHRSGC